MNAILNHLKSDWYKYLLETLVVILGILVAFSLNSWKDSVRHKEDVKQLYGDLAQELNTDLIEIQGNRSYNLRYLSRFKHASEIILSDKEMVMADTLAQIATELTNFSDFEKAEIAYNILSTSGKIDLVTNREIQEQLQKLGSLYTYINRLEKNHEDLMFMTVPRISNYIRIKPLEVIQVDGLYGYRFHNDITLFIKIGEEKEVLYQRAENSLNTLMTSLQKDLD